MLNGWLHIGNIAGNGFEAARMQQRRGMASDVINPFLTHVMSHPIWEDIEVSIHIDLNDVESLLKSNPEWNLPSYYYGGDLEKALRLLAEKRGIVLLDSHGTLENAMNRWRAFGRFTYRKLKALRQVTKIKKVKIAQNATLVDAKDKGAISQVGRQESAEIWSLKFFQSIYRMCFFLYLIPFKLIYLLNSRKIHREFPNLPTDQFYLISALRQLNQIAPHYKGIALYGPWVALGAWCKDLEYVAVEHGTLRDFIFDSWSWAIACRVGYKKARKVIVTNADCYPISLAERHKESIAGIHPVESKLFEVFATERTNVINKNHGVLKDVVLAARIQFSSSGDAKGSEIALDAIRELSQMDPELRFTIFAYGDDLGLAKSLVAQYELSDVLEISPPLSRPLLMAKFASALCVLDGFSLSGSGRIQIEAWAIGTPVLSKQDLKLNEYFFVEPVPTLNASSKNEIVDSVLCLRKLSGRDLIEFQQQSMVWYRKHHSPERFLSYLSWD